MKALEVLLTEVNVLLENWLWIMTDSLNKQLILLMIALDYYISSRK